MTAKPAEPVKFEMVLNLSFDAYSEKNSSFFGITYPSILNFEKFLFNRLMIF